MIAVQDGGDVDVDNVTFAQNAFFAWNAMADDFVDRGANGSREAMVVEGGRDPAVIDRVLMDEVVDVHGADARTHKLTCEFEGAGGQDTRGTHDLNFCGALAFNHR